jgi:hypothetical protein
MRIGDEIVGPQNERSRIAVLSVENDGLQEGHLKGLADVVGAEACQGGLAGIGEAAWRVAESQKGPESDRG